MGQGLDRLDVFKCNADGTIILDANRKTMNGFKIYCLLSAPRASYVRNYDGRIGEGFTVCATCKQNLSNCVVPKYAIANNYCFGSPPECLRTLTDVELALLTPINTAFRTRVARTRNSKEAFHIIKWQWKVFLGLCLILACLGWSRIL